MKVPILNLDALTEGEKEIDFSFSKETYNISHIAHLIKRNQDSAARQGTHSTKTRGEVAGGGAKPYKQKGTGKARRGSNRTPLRVGGGVSFGPKPRKYFVGVNRRVVKLGYKLLTRELSGRICILDETSLGAVKTRLFSDFLRKASPVRLGKVLLVVTENPQDDRVILSARNLEYVTCTYSTWIPVELFATSDFVVFTTSAFSDLEERVFK